MTSPIAFVLKGYPRLSETFIAQEILALQRRGLDIRLVSLRHPTDKARHPIHGEISAELAAPVNYLPEYLYNEPLRVLRAWWRVRGLAGYRRALKTWTRDLARDATPNRIRRFGQALVLADELPDGIALIHAHFLHTPASVARYAAIIRGLDWTCSAHAKDIWTSPQWELVEKLDDCRWLVTCTRVNADYLGGLASRPGVVSLVYHGLDFSRFPMPSKNRPGADGHDPDHPVTILSVGRAVEKKGFDGLLRALKSLPEALNWHFVHIGGGPMMDHLQRLSETCTIGNKITWLGPQSQETVLDHYRNADIFVLNCRIATDGDRDGLPNVLMEAQSQGLACLSTTVSAIPELIIDNQTGSLVAPDDDKALAGALARLIGEPALRHRLGVAGMERVREHFCHQGGIDDLVQRFTSGTSSK